MPEVATPLVVPLSPWASRFAKRWNSGMYSVFLLHGNIFDVLPLVKDDKVEYRPLPEYINARLLPKRKHILFFDVADNLTFGSVESQKAFFQWIATFDKIQGTKYAQDGLPRDFSRMSVILRRFFQKVADDGENATLIISFPEKIVPATDEAGASPEERASAVALMKWAIQGSVAHRDIGIILLAETVSELAPDILQSQHIAQVAVELPDLEERKRFLLNLPIEAGLNWTTLSTDQLAAATSGLTLTRIHQLTAEAIRSKTPCTIEFVASTKKRLIEEYCEGLIRFKTPKPGLSLESVATHTAAKKRLRELAWLIKNNKSTVLERGVLLPGRVGVGKSFLVDCFASECGLPVMEMGEFRSKWVGDTERQQARILLTIRSLGPVIVVVDEADAVFGNRESDGDSGVSSRVFAAFAAHIGDSSLRGRELWIAMTSRPDLLAIDMKRQGRFGLCVPLFPAQNVEDVLELFAVVAKTKGVPLTDDLRTYIREKIGPRPLTGSDVEAIVIRAKERAVLAEREEVTSDDFREAVESFIDPLDPDLLILQELAAVLACSDKRYLPPAYAEKQREDLQMAYGHAKMRVRMR